MRLELTRRADYAIRTSICLAGEGRERLVPAPDIARRMDVPPRFLPQIMQDLVRAGLVEASPGRGGGYRDRTREGPAPAAGLVHHRGGDAVSGLKVLGDHPSQHILEIAPRMTHPLVQRLIFKPGVRA